MPYEGEDLTRLSQSVKLVMSVTNHMVSTTRVENLLPDPPDGYSYSIERVSPMVLKVWLNHPDHFNYTDEPVRTIYCFIKNDRVHPPKNHKTMRPKSLCSVHELFTMPCYTTIIPTTTSLLHLL
jgi:hypothetical protein